MKLTELEIQNLVFNRSVTEGLIKDTQIKSSYHWVTNWIDEEFMSILEESYLDASEDLEASEDPTLNPYYDFIEEYIKPIWAWGTLYDHFEYISLNITDKGIVQLVTEGTANLIGRDSRLDSKMETKNLCYNLIKRMHRFANTQKINGDPLFELYKPSKLTPSLVKFSGRESINKLPY